MARRLTETCESVKRARRWALLPLGFDLLDDLLDGGGFVGPAAGETADRTVLGDRHLHAHLVEVAIATHAVVAAFHAELRQLTQSDIAWSGGCGSRRQHPSGWGEWHAAGRCDSQSFTVVLGSPGEGRGRAGRAGDVRSALEPGRVVSVAGAGVGARAAGRRAEQ